MLMAYCSSLMTPPLAKENQAHSSHSKEISIKQIQDLRVALWCRRDDSGLSESNYVIYIFGKYH